MSGWPGRVMGTGRRSRGCARRGGGARRCSRRSCCLSRHTLKPARFGIHPALLDAALHAQLLTAEPDGQDSECRPLLPFSWGEVTLHAAGASALRACISPAGPDAVSLAVADAAGGPVASVASLVVRPASAAQLDGGVRDWLLTLAWNTFPQPAADDIDVAVAGPDVSHVLRDLAPAYPDLEALTRATAAGAAAPDMVVHFVPPVHGDDIAAIARSVTNDLLTWVQAWLSDTGFAASRLAVVTSGAVATGAGGPVDLGAAPCWGLIRAAEAENPGRFVLVDIDSHDSSARRLRAALASGEPEIAVREGRALSGSPPHCGVGCRERWWRPDGIPRARC